MLLLGKERRIEYQRHETIDAGVKPSGTGYEFVGRNVRAFPVTLAEPNTNNPLDAIAEPKGALPVPAEGLPELCHVPFRPPQNFCAAMSMATMIMSDAAASPAPVYEALDPL